MNVEVDVYADLLFLINAGMDGLCLGMTARLLHRRPKAWRMIAASVLGGIYAVLALLPDIGQAAALAMDIGVCLLMCAVAFGERTRGAVRRLGGAAAVYVVLSMVLGGVMTAVFNLCNRAGLSEHIPSGEDGLGAWVFALVTLLGSTMTLWGGRLFNRSRATVTCRVTVEIDGRSAVWRGLVDTGNLLCDPLGGHPVICVAPASAADVLSPTLLAFVSAPVPDVATLHDEHEIRRLRFIPTKTATGSGLLPGLRPDRVLISPDGREEMSREVDAVLAFADLDKDDGIEALVPGELIK